MFRLHDFRAGNMRWQVVGEDFGQKIAVALEISTHAAADDDDIGLNSWYDRQKTPRNSVGDLAPSSLVFYIAGEFFVVTDDGAPRSETFPLADFAFVFD